MKPSAERIFATLFAINVRYGMDVQEAGEHARLALRLFCAVHGGGMMYVAMNDAHRDRDASIVDMRTRGWSYGRIASELGMSRGGVFKAARRLGVCSVHRIEARGEHPATNARAHSELEAA